MSLRLYLVRLFIRLANLISSKNYFSVLTYHRVMPNEGLESSSALPPEVFEQQLIWLKKYFNVLPLPIAILLAGQRKLPANSVVITIDDGFVDCFNYVYPLLERHQLKATFFVTTSGLSLGSLWENRIIKAIEHLNVDKKQAILFDQIYTWHDLLSCQLVIQKITELIKYQPISIREKLITELEKQADNVGQELNSFLTKEQLKTLYLSGMTIGAHTVNHPILALESSETALNEIRDSKSELENIIGDSVCYFAYPNGKFEQDFTEEHVEIVKSLCFEAAFSTDWGVANLNNGNRFLIKRFTPWDKDPALFCLRLALSNLSEQYGFRWIKPLFRKK